ncbi:hypothetical protein Tco_1313890 [Tanacetum coccineum]
MMEMPFGTELRLKLIRYALTKSPTIYVSLIEKFWQTTTVRTVNNGEQEITATVDGKEFTITEASVRRHLQLADVEGISALPTTKIFDQLSLMGYVLTDDKLTFQKGKFSPQWRFLIHTILHCLSSKKTSWEQFSSNIATAIICLATNRTFNFSKLIFDGMVKNLDSKYKFLMYPRFIQIFLDKHKRFLNPHNRKYIAPTLTPKLFSNMKRGFSGEQTPLFPSMLAIQAEEGEGSGHPSEPQPPPSTAQPIHEEPIPNIVSSSHQKTQTPRQALNQVTELPQTSEPRPNVLDEAVYEEWDDRVESATTTVVVLGAKKLRGVPLLRLGLRGYLHRLMIYLSQELIRLKVIRAKTVKTIQARRRTKIVVSDDDEDLEDSSKQGRMIEEIDQDAGVTLVTPTHSQEDQPEDQLGVFSAAKVLVVAARNVQTYTRRRRAVSTGSGGVSTASRLFSSAEESVSTAGALMPVSTAGMVQEVNKDKGKGIMTESEPKQIKTKLQQSQERAGYEAAVRLQEQLDEEERHRIARVHEEAKSFSIEEWENIQATIEADEELAQRIQAEEREKYSKAEKARLLVELINQRKRYFAQQRAEERRNKPLTQAQ